MSFTNALPHTERRRRSHLHIPNCNSTLCHQPKTVNKKGANCSHNLRGFGPIRSIPISMSDVCQILLSHNIGILHHKHLFHIETGITFAITEYSTAFLRSTST